MSEIVAYGIMLETVTAEFAWQHREINRTNYNYVLIPYFLGKIIYILGWSGGAVGDSDVARTASPILVILTFLWCTLFSKMRL